MLLNRFYSCVIISTILISSIFYGGAHLAVWSSLFAGVLICWFLVILRSPPPEMGKIEKLPAIIGIICLLYFFLQSFFAQIYFIPPYFEKLGVASQKIPLLVSHYSNEIAVYKWILPFLVLFLVPQIITSSKQAYFFITGIILVGIAEAILGFSQFAYYDPTVSYIPKIQGDVHGTFVTRNTYACLLAVIAMLTVSWLIKFTTRSLKKSSKKNLIIATWQSRHFSKISMLLVASLILILPIFFSLSRGAILSFIASCIFFFLLYAYLKEVPLRKTVSNIRFLLPVFAILGIYLYMSVFYNVYERFSLIVEKDEARWDLWKITWNIICDYPIFGTGGGSFYAISPAYNIGLKHFLYAHNDYLQMLMEYGVVGFSLSFLFVFIWAKTSWKHKDNSVLSKTLWSGVAASCFVFFCHALVDFNFQIDSHRILCASLMGLLLAQKKYKIEKVILSPKIKFYAFIFVIYSLFLSVVLFHYAYSSYIEPKLFFKEFYEKENQDVVAQREWMQKELSKFRESYRWNQRSPLLTYKIGFLCRQISQIHIRQKYEYLNEAQKYLYYTRTILPTFHQTYIHLAYIYYQKKEYENADKAMLFAQVLAPYDYEYAIHIAKYWWQRWRDTRDKKHLKLIADRFYILAQNNQGNLSKMLDTWSYLAPHYDEKEPWHGVIYPKEESFAIVAVYHFLSKDKMHIAQQIFRNVKDEKIRNTLLGNFAILEQKDEEKAMLLYQQGVKDSENRDKVIFLLIKNKYFSLAISLLGNTFDDDLAIRLRIAKYALEQKIVPEKIYEFLTNTKKLFSPTAEYFYTFAKVAGKIGKIQEKFLYAEQAVLHHKQNNKYLFFFLHHLFQRKRYTEVKSYAQKYGLFSSDKFALYSWLTREFYKRKQYAQSLFWGEKAEKFNNKNSDFQLLLDKIRSQ